MAAPRSPRCRSVRHSPAAANTTATAPSSLLFFSSMKARLGGSKTHSCRPDDSRISSDSTSRLGPHRASQHRSCQFVKFGTAPTYCAWPARWQGFPDRTSGPLVRKALPPLSTPNTLHSIWRWPGTVRICPRLSQCCAVLDVTNWAVQSYDDLCESSPPGAVCVGVSIGRTVDARRPSTEKVDNVGRSIAQYC